MNPYQGDLNAYAPPTDRFYKDDDSIGGTRTLSFPNNRFEIFARCAQSRSRALGAVDVDVTGFTSRDLHIDGDWGLHYDEQHYSHSREFRSNIINEWTYWKSVGFDFKLIGNNFTRRLN